jgi:hypothetical protein
LQEEQDTTTVAPHAGTKKATNMARLALVAAVVLCLLLATGPQGAVSAEGMVSFDNLISCKVLGNCDKNLGPEASRPGKPANDYTRGCNPITGCRG